MLTGFLGAGKTTLLNRLLKDPALAETAVIINEFGEIGLDHLLVEHVEDGVMLLSTGCLCCTMRGDLVDTLEKLLRGLDNGRMSFNRVIIETTGSGRSGAGAAHRDGASLPGAALPPRRRHHGGRRDQRRRDARPHLEAVKQAAVADRIVLTKTDLAETPERRDAVARCARGSRRSIRPRR